MRATAWFDVIDLLAYWADHPPVHELVAAYLGVKPKARSLSKIVKVADGADPSGIGDLIRRFPNGMVLADR